MRARNTLIIGVLSFLVLVTGGAATMYKQQSVGTIKIIEKPMASSTASSSSIAQDSSLTATDAIDHSPSSTSSSAPSSARIDGVRITVPFQSQTPLGVWDPLHEETCEEASLLLVKHFLGETTPTPVEMDAELLDLVQWETENGYGWDVGIDEMKSIAQDRYGFAGTILDNVDVDTLEEMLRQGNPVIIPAAGRLLGNPYFSGEGPIYHMIVIVGYDKTSFITHDVGTKRGENYRYRKDVLMNAIHDWTGGEDDILLGAKRALVLHRNEGAL